MFLIELMKSQQNLSYGDMIAMFKDMNDALDYGRSKSRSQSAIVKVTSGRGVLWYFLSGEQVQWNGRPLNEQD